MDSEKKLPNVSETEIDTNPQTLDLRTRFLEAARNGHNNVVRGLLRQRPTIQKDDIDHALREASANGRGVVVKTLLDAGANVNAVPPWEYGATALQKAVENEHAEIVSILLEAGAKVNPDPENIEAESDKASDRRSLEGTTGGGAEEFSLVTTMLQYAAKSGNIKIVELLINRGAHINLLGPPPPGAISGPNLPTWPLHIAAEEGHTAVVRILLHHGARIDAGVPSRTALQVAAEAGHRDVVEVLLDASVDANIDISTRDTRGRTCLIWGISHPEVIKLLLQRGADVRSQDVGGLTALHVAAEQGYEGVVRILLEFKPDINARDIYGQTCLYKGHSHSNIVQLLLAGGANTEFQAFDGTTPLHRAIKGSHSDSVMLLLQAGADIESEDYEYQKPLDILLNDLEPRALPTKPVGADIESEDYGYQKPLDISLNEPEPRALPTKLLELLLEHGCNIKGKTIDSWRKILRSTNDADIVMVEESPALPFGPSPFESPGPETRVNEDGTTVSDKPKINIKLDGAQKPPTFIASSRLELPTIRRLYSASGTKFLFPELEVEGVRVFKPEDRVIAAGDAVVEWQWFLLDKFQMKSGLGLPKVNQVISESNEHAQSLLRCYVSFNFFMEDPDSKKAPENSFRKKTKKSEISWIMRKVRIDIKDINADTDSNENSNSADSHFIFRSEDFRSTLNIGWVPKTGVDFFTLFIHDLYEKWKDLLEKIDEHLDNNFDTLLENKGETASFIESLLWDAQQWGKMQALLRAQVHKSKDLVEDFQKVWWLSSKKADKEEGIKKLSKAIESMEEIVGEELEKISQSTKEMIQFELNLVSVNEARISVSEAKVSKELGMSMKRLSWITFVFLPLMFVASLFGMNVDAITADGPHWTWVVKLSVFVFALVILVWLGLKLIPIDKWLETHLFEPLRKKWKETMRSKGQSEPKSPSRQLSNPKEETTPDDTESRETANRVLPSGVARRQWFRSGRKMRSNDLESGKVASGTDAPRPSEQDSKLKGL